jgi:outer membrane protein TolC
MRIVFFLFVSIPLFGQTIDTTQLFTPEDYLGWVRAYHPVMKTAALLEGKADAGLLKARGALDPKWFGDYEDKSFDQKNYFRVGEAGLKVPTWWGIDVKLAYRWSNGDFLNPEAKLPKNGQAIIGLEVPLLQGVIFDQRRAQIQQAQLYRDANEASRRSIINNLLLEAVEYYWQWAYQYQVVRIYETSLRLAEDRFRIIRESFLQGDKPAIDTLESLIQMQNRQLQLSQAEVELQNAVLELSNFLWYEDLVPLEVSAQLRPVEPSSEWPAGEPNISPALFRNLKQTHPDLQALMVKQKQLGIKERLKREQFKPRLNLKYNFLGNGFNLSAENPNNNNLNNVLLENYKWGLKFSYPLLLRKERSGLQLVRLEQLETEYKIGNKELAITNKIKGILQLLETTADQLITQQDMVANYEALLDAENEKFRIGESSIFLLNNREQKLIESQMKNIKLQVSFEKLQWKLAWAKGELR